MSADFRLRDPAVYAEWYGGAHSAPALLQRRGLRAHRALCRQDQIGADRCLPGLLPDRGAACAAAARQGEGRSRPTPIIIDAKSGVSGAGRSLKQNILFSEAGEGVSPYGIGNHRHVPEIEQELGAAAKATGAGHLHAASHAHEPRRALHLLCHAEGKATAADLRQALAKAYEKSPFVRVVERA